ARLLTAAGRRQGDQHQDQERLHPHRVITPVAVGGLSPCRVPTSRPRMTYDFGSRPNTPRSNPVALAGGAVRADREGHAKSWRVEKSKIRVADFVARMVEEERREVWKLARSVSSSLSIRGRSPSSPKAT